MVEGNRIVLIEEGMKELIIKSKTYGNQKILLDDIIYNEIKDFSPTLQKHNDRFNVCIWIPRFKRTIKLRRFIFGIFDVKNRSRIISLDGNQFNYQKDNLLLLQANRYIQKEHHFELIINDKELGDVTVLFDKQFYGIVSSHSWKLTKNSTSRTIYVSCFEDSLHRLVMGIPRGSRYEVDHVNMNGIDNRLCNLRLATPTQNKANQIKKSNNKTGYKGVVKGKYNKSYAAIIRIGDKSLYKGKFSTAKEAALQYDEWALKYYGEFAQLNIKP
jgi:hypothetical protein